MPSVEEEIASENLDIFGYAGKWRQAQQYELGDPRTDDTRLLPYWERVRLTFLELGGQYLGQKQ
jgi:hypothetical protein